MRGILRLIIVGGLAAGLAGCEHQLSLTPLDGGQPGVGASQVRGPLLVKLDGKVYRGHWRTGAAGGDLPAPKVDRAPVQVGRYYGMRGASGYRVADFVARDGSTLVCRFRYERGQENGSGLCQSDRGRTFSLVID
jgi:hypothetical protein